MHSGGAGVSRALLTALAFGFFCPAPAFAHKLYVFAERIEDAVIHGRAYFPGDVAAQNINVIVSDPSGRELGRTTTDENGRFTFTARTRVDHHLLAKTADGHGGQCVVRASALPDSLPTEVAAASGDSVPPPATSQAGPPAESAGGEPESIAIREQLKELGRQMDQLRGQVNESEERLRFRDILGGIGFIVGLAGAALYMKARRTQFGAGLPTPPKGPAGGLPNGP